MHCGWVLGPQLLAALARRPAVTLTPRIPLKRGQPTSRLPTVQPHQRGVFGHCQVEMWRWSSGGPLLDTYLPTEPTCQCLGAYP